MNRINVCQACNAEKNGVKSRIAFEHTCGKGLGDFVSKQMEKTLERLSGNIDDEPVAPGVTPATKMNCIVARVTGRASELLKEPISFIMKGNHDAVLVELVGHIRKILDERFASLLENIEGGIPQSVTLEIKIAGVSHHPVI